MTAAHPDLFGAPEPAAPARYVVKRQHLLNSLNDVLNKMRAASDWPWSVTQTGRIRENTWPYLLGLLPEAEVAEWREAFNREAARLDAASERLAA